jgi:hypothetical protein
MESRLSSEWRRSPDGGTRPKFLSLRILVPDSGARDPCLKIVPSNLLREPWRGVTSGVGRSHYGPKNERVVCNTPGGMGPFFGKHCGGEGSFYPEQPPRPCENYNLSLMVGLVGRVVSSPGPFTSSHSVNMIISFHIDCSNAMPRSAGGSPPECGSNWERTSLQRTCPLLPKTLRRDDSEPLPHHGIVILVVEFLDTKSFSLVPALIEDTLKPYP